MTELYTNFINGRYYLTMPHKRPTKWTTTDVCFFTSSLTQPFLNQCLIVYSSVTFFCIFPLQTGIIQPLSLSHPLPPSYVLDDPLSAVDAPLFCFLFVKVSRMRWRTKRRQSSSWPTSCSFWTEPTSFMWKTQTMRIMRKTIGWYGG